MPIFLFRNVLGSICHCRGDLQCPDAGEVQADDEAKGRGSNKQAFKGLGSLASASLPSECAEGLVRCTALLDLFLPCGVMKRWNWGVVLSTPHGLKGSRGKERRARTAQLLGCQGYFESLFLKKKERGRKESVGGLGAPLGLRPSCSYIYEDRIENVLDYFFHQ